MKLLIVPKSDVTFYDHNYSIFDYNFFSSWLMKKRFRKPTYESLYYTEMPVVAGEDKVYILGSYHKQYLLKKVPPYSINPSAHNSPNCRSISLEDALSNLSFFDAILFSTDALVKAKEIKEKAIQQGIFLAILDFFDHEEMFDEPSTKLLTRGLKEGRDFNIYFKNAIPIGMATDTILPICPIPIREYNFSLNPISFEERQISIFFRGIMHKEITNKNRKALMEMLPSIPNSRIEISTEIKTSNDNYLDTLSKSRFALSPPGRSWTTTRHTILSIAECVPIIPIPDCETHDLVLEDGFNSITFPMLRYLDEERKKGVALEIVDKINYYEQNLSKAKALASQWKKQVLSKHTTRARTNYIYSSIKERL